MNLIDLKVGDIYTLPGYVSFTLDKWNTARHKITKIDSLSGLIYYELLDDANSIAKIGFKSKDLFIDLLKWDIKIKTKKSYLPEWL